MDGTGLRIVVKALEMRIGGVAVEAQDPLRKALRLARDAAQDPMACTLQRQLSRAALARLERPEGTVADLVWAIRALAAGRVEEAALMTRDDRYGEVLMPALVGVGRCA